MWKPYCFNHENINKIREMYQTSDSEDNFLYEAFIKHSSKSENNTEIEFEVEEDVKPFIKFHSIKYESREMVETKQHFKDSQIKEENVKLNELKDQFSCLKNDNSQNEIILKLLGDILCNINPKHIPNICEYLEINKLNETDFYLGFCKLILQLTPQITFFMSVALIQHLLYPKVINLNNRPSRLLISTVLEWTKISPKVMLEGLYIPYIQNNCLEKVQVDLIIRIIKESLPSDQADIYLREILQAAKTIEESHILIIQTLIDKKVNFEEILDILFSELLKVAEYHNQSLTFAKLLLTILTKLENQIKSTHLSTLDKIIKINKTFLKSSAEKSFQKLSAKHSSNES